jgi:hypothetical protein
LSRNTRLVVVTRGSAPQSSASWAKGQCAIAIVAATVGVNADADANAVIVVVVNVDVVSSATHGLAPQSSTSWLKGRHATVIIAATVGADANADADADAGVVVVVVIPPAIPPPVAAVKGVDRLHRATTIPARPGIVSFWLELWRMVMSRVKTGYFIPFWEISLRTKKGEKKVFVRQKTLDEKWNGFHRTEFCFFHGVDYTAPEWICTILFFRWSNDYTNCTIRIRILGQPGVP